MHHLSIAISHLATLFVNMHKRAHARAPPQAGTDTPLCRPTPSWNGENPLLPFVMCYHRCCHHFVTPFCPSISPCAARVHLFRFLSLFLSRLAGLGCSFNVDVYSDALPSFSLHPPPLPVSPTAPACPAFVTSLVSITTATFPSCLTIFNQEQRTTEMRCERGENLDGKVTLVMHRNKKTQLSLLKEKYVRAIRASLHEQSSGKGNTQGNR